MAAGYEFTTGLTASGYAIRVYVDTVTAHVDTPDGERVTLQGGTLQLARKVKALPGQWAADCAADLYRMSTRIERSRRAMLAMERACIAGTVCVWPPRLAGEPGTERKAVIRYR